MASQFGFQLNLIARATPQAFYVSRPTNNYRGNRQGNSHGNNLRGNFQNRSRDNNNLSSSRQFAWASTQNIVFGNCNRCGIGHLPSQCPNNQDASNPTRSNLQANFATYADNVSTSNTTLFPNTSANSHTTPDLSNLDTSEFYRGPDSLHVGDGNSLPILHIRSSKIYSSNQTFNLSNILHVPEVKKYFICPTIL